MKDVPSVSILDIKPKTFIIVLSILCSILCLQAKHSPILFIHGLGGDSTDWEPMKERFINDGWSSDDLFAYTFSEPSTQKDGANEKNAHEIAARVNEIIDKNNYPKIAVITYSMGGLSGRYYIKFLDGFTKVSTFISLVAPHHGSTHLGLQEGDMKTDSPFLTKLNEGDETPYGKLVDDSGSTIPGSIQWYAFGGGNTDNVIQPPSSAFLSGCTNREFDLEHYDFLLDSSVYFYIKYAVMDSIIGIKCLQNPHKNLKTLIKHSYQHTHSPTISIVYDTPNSGMVNLRILNARGQCIDNIFNGFQKAGIHTVQWDKTKHVSIDPPSGIYYILLRINSISDISTVVISR